MPFLGKKNLSRVILSKAYLLNFLAILAIVCMIGFGVNSKFKDIKEDIRASNQYLVNLISNHLKTVDNELKFIQKTMLTNAADVKNIFEFLLKDDEKYLAFFIVAKDGGIELATDDGLGKKYAEFFLAHPWQNDDREILKSKFIFDGDALARFIAKKFADGRILVALVKFKFANQTIKNSAESFIIDHGGKVLAHSEDEVVFEQKSVFDIYDVEADYLSDNDIKIAEFGSKDFDVYLVGNVENAEVAVVSYYPVKELVKSNLLVLIVCAILLVVSVIFIVLYAKFMKNNVIKPILAIKNLVNKMKAQKEIKKYIDFEGVSEFSEITQAMLQIYEECRLQNAKFNDFKQKFGFLFKKGPFIILLIDAKTGDIVDASSKALSFYGLSKEQILQKNIQEFNVNLISQMNIIDGGDEQIYETRHIAANGEIKEVRIRKQNFQTSSEKLGFCIVKDVTQENILKRNMLKENELNVYSPIFSVVWKDRFLNRVSNVSANAQNLLGYSVEEMLDEKFDFTAIIRPDDAAKILNEFNIKFRLFGARVHKSEYESLQTCTLVKKNLELLRCNVFIRFVSKDGKNIDEIIGYFVQEELMRKIATNALGGMQTNIYKKIIENLLAYSNEAIAIVDANGVFIDINDKFCKISGYEKDEVIGKPSNLLKSGEHDQRFYETLWQSVLKEGYFGGQIYNKRKNGEIYLEHLNISTLYDDEGRVHCFLAVFHEIKEDEFREKEHA